MPQKIIIVRHGETQYNADRRIQGQVDVPLNCNGKEQAKKVAERLKGEIVTAIYTSDHKRAHTTARYIGKKLGLNLRKRQALREDRMGIFEGWAWEKEIDKRKELLWDARIKARESGDILWKEHGGDSLKEHTARVKKIIKEIEAKYIDKTVLIVSHGNTINRIMEIYGFKKVEEQYISYKNTSVTILVKKGNAYELTIHNDISHL